MASVSHEQIEETIKAMLVSELEMDPCVCNASTPATPLLGRGVGLDSIDALALIAALEKLYDIEVEDSELTVALFKTIRSLAEFVAHKVAQPRAASPI